MLRRILRFRRAVRLLDDGVSAADAAAAPVTPTNRTCTARSVN
jgi:hypothetical protein